MSELTTVLTEAFDVASEEGTPAFEPIPAGTYVAAIKDIKVGPLKSGRGQAVLATWEIVDDKRRALYLVFLAVSAARSRRLSQTILRWRLLRGANLPDKELPTLGSWCRSSSRVLCLECA